MSTDETVALVESAANQKLPLDSLVTSAAESFRLIEPWSQATSTDPVLLDIIRNIKAQASAYYVALDMSLKTADSGYTFSQTSEELCQYLIDPTNTNVELIGFIQRMRDVARNSHQKAKDTSERFRSVRSELNRITQTIPLGVAAQLENKAQADEKITVAKRKRNTSRIVGGIASTGAATVGASNVFGAALPSQAGVIILPIILPIVAFISQLAEAKYSKEITKRENEARSCVDAVKLLEQASADLSAFAECVDMFANWWVKIDSMLDAVESKIGQLRAGFILKLNVTSISASWRGVGQSYLNYKQQISKLQDLYPQSRLGIPDTQYNHGETAKKPKLAWRSPTRESRKMEAR